jgi:predicted transcriptional regulator
MTDNPQLIEAVEQIAISDKVAVFVPIADEFHTVNHVIPDDQVLTTIPPNMLVTEALEIMRKNHYSQLPVLSGERIIGVFSYRSYAEEITSIYDTKDKPDIKQLQVHNFLENLPTIQIFEDIEKVFSPINEYDYLLVGKADKLLGLITAADLLRYFYKYAAVYMMLSEIERTIRKIIQECADEQKIIEYAVLTLNNIYPADRIPKSIYEMTMNDYAQVIGDSRCYQTFEIIFGPGDWQRKRTRSNLVEISRFRNDAFHFRREITMQDIDSLFGYRDWLKSVTSAYEGKK